MNNFPNIAIPDFIRLLHPRRGIECWYLASVLDFEPLPLDITKWDAVNSVVQTTAAVEGGPGAVFE